MILLLTEGQVSDYRGAERVLPALPDADVLIADRGYDSDWFREALRERDIAPCIPGRKNRKQPIDYDTELYKQRNLVERMFGRLKDCNYSPPPCAAPDCVIHTMDESGRS